MDNALNTTNCEECKRILPQSNVKECKFCKKNVCDKCISRKYPNWTLTGCKIKPIWNKKLIAYHCIYSMTHDNIKYILVVMMHIFKYL